MPNQKIFGQLLIFVSLYYHAKKWACFIDLFWRNSWFKNPAIWLAESIFAYVLGTRLPKYKICAGTQQIIEIFITFFCYKKHFYKKMSLKNPITLKKMLRKSPVSNAWAAIFKNAGSCRALYKLQNWVNFSIFSYLKFFPVFIVNGSTIQPLQ